MLWRSFHDRRAAVPSKGQNFYTIYWYGSHLVLVDSIFYGADQSFFDLASHIPWSRLRSTPFTQSIYTHIRCKSFCRLWPLTFFVSMDKRRRSTRNKKDGSVVEADPAVTKEKVYVFYSPWSWIEWPICRDSSRNRRVPRTPSPVIVEEPQVPSTPRTKRCVLSVSLFISF